MGIKYIVQGAICQCQFGSATDEVVVKTQSSLYLNDLQSAKKLAVTTTDIGATFKKNCFGSCTKKNNDPCTVTVTQWSNPEVQKVEGAGNLLTENSQATCPIGGTNCISIVHHGQQAEPSQQNVKNTSEEVRSQINPWTEPEELSQPEKTEVKLKASSHA
ncbi:DUF4280 domain-containing protein [Apibacter muscae]|uniref:DUF4280 domain-containing protein n=1 Tax=Apibacter muscae TaxID=2509004 RepID=UPI0011ACEDAF|nr:DUF4280 domain-containing protein [Apibacter muscae]TWP30757.1 DUF4280 domain-containing protein [Apibacter muscae]